MGEHYNFVSREIEQHIYMFWFTATLKTHAEVRRTTSADVAP